MESSFADHLIVQRRGLVEYEGTLVRMNEFTTKRMQDTIDQFWQLQHHPVYTLGHAADRAHLLDTGVIPVVQSDRGGEVTYHGPGQVVLYLLVDLNRKGIGPRVLVDHIEGAIIDLLADYGIVGSKRAGAPGVYVRDAKIAALGLRVRRGCSFHGLSLNVDMDLAPFAGIDPCGYAGLQVTRLADHGVAEAPDAVAAALTALLIRRLGYSRVEYRDLEELP